MNYASLIAKQQKQRALDASWMVFQPPVAVDEAGAQIELGQSFLSGVQGVGGGVSTGVSELARRTDEQALQYANGLIDWLHDDEQLHPSLIVGEVSPLVDFEAAVDDVLGTINGRGSALVKGIWSGARERVKGIEKAIRADALAEAEDRIAAAIALNSGATPDDMGHDPTVRNHMRALALMSDEVRQWYIERAQKDYARMEAGYEKVVEQLEKYARQREAWQLGRTPDFTDIRDLKTAMDWLVVQGGQGIASVAEFMVVGATTGGYGVVPYAMLSELGSMASEADLRDPNDPNAVNRITLFAGLSALTELGVGAPTRMLGLRRQLNPMQQVSKDVQDRVSKGYFRRLGREVGGNALEEFAQEGIQHYLSEMGVKGDDFRFDNETLLGAFNAGMIGMLSGGGFGLAFNARSQVALEKEAQRHRDAGTLVRSVEELAAVTKDLKLPSLSPKAFKQLAERLGLGNMRIFYQAEAIHDFVEQQGGDLETTLKDLGVDVADFMTALANGNRVVVSGTGLVTGGKLQQPTAVEFWATNGSLRPDGGSQLELDALPEARQQILADLRNQLEVGGQSPSRALLIAQISDQAVAAGMSPEYATQAATVLAAGFETLAWRYSGGTGDMSGSQLFAKFGFDIEGAKAALEEQLSEIPAPTDTATTPAEGQPPAAGATTPAPAATQPAAGATDTPLMPTNPVGAPAAAAAAGATTPAPAATQPAARLSPAQKVAADIAAEAEAASADEAARPRSWRDHFSSRRLANRRTMNQPALDLFDTPLPMDKRTIKNLAQQLTDRHMAIYGRKLFPETSEEDFDIVVESMALELQAQMARPNSGVGWYSLDVERALHDQARVPGFESLLTNEGHRNLFLTMAGIFSSGTDPDQAWGSAARAFEGAVAVDPVKVPITRADAAAQLGQEPEMTTFKSKTGEEVTQLKSWGIRGKGNSEHLALISHLVQKVGGLQEAATWLMERHPRAEINAMVVESGVYKVGPFTTKKSLTEDQPQEFGALIFGPKLGRYTVGLFGVPVKASDTTIDLWYVRSYRRMTGRLFDKPIGKEGIAAQPANDAEREAIWRVTSALADRMGITPGDVQAAMWFFEKRLYGEHGITVKEGTNSSGAARFTASRGLPPYDGGAGARTDQVAGTAEAEADGVRGVRAASGGYAAFRGRRFNVVQEFGGSRPVIETDDAEGFRDLISRAQQEIGPAGAQVEVYDDYSGKRLFLFDDGYSGFALDGDNIISVFSVNTGYTSNAVRHLIPLAVEQGGRRLDAFDTYLPTLYSSVSFRAVAALDFSREHAPKGWDYAAAGQFNNGEPDIVFMVFDPENPGATTDVRVPDYDAGIAKQDEALSRILEQPGWHGTPHTFPPSALVRDTETGKSYVHPKDDLLAGLMDKFPGRYEILEENDKGMFDHSKMGTGEGMQAVGWGTYIGEEYKTADTYRPRSDTYNRGVRLGTPPVDLRSITSTSIYAQLFPVLRDLTMTVDGREVGNEEILSAADAVVSYAAGEASRYLDKQPSMDPKEALHNALIQYERETYAFEDQAQREIDDPDTNPKYRGFAQDRLYALRLERALIKTLTSEPLPEVTRTPRPGRMYRVEVPDNDQLMKFEDPLSEQPEAVQAAIKGMLTEMINAQLDRGTADSEYRVQLMNELLAMVEGVEGVGDDDLMRAFVTDATGRDFYYALSRVLGGDRQASEALAAAGIPGHRFLDGFSRSSGEGTHNFVIYDETAMRILDFEQATPRGPRGSISLPAGGLSEGVVIRLMESADASTLMHEAGHFFLEMYRELASDAAAPADMKADFAAINTWLGRAEGDTGTFTTAQHEQFAEGFEKYLMTGKAPSVSLQSAFSLFKRWLVKIYQSIPMMQQHLTPEVRDIFDRMLATDEEIELAKIEESMGPLLIQKPAGMADKDYEGYRRSASLVDAEASETLLTKALDVVKAKRTKEWKEERARLVAKHTELLAEEHVYQLLSRLERDGVQLNRKELVERFDKEIAGELAKYGRGKRSILHNDGASLDSVAELSGYGSVDDMVTDLYTSQPLAEAAEMAAVREQEATLEDITTNGSMREEAVAALHNNRRWRLLHTEQAELRRQIAEADPTISLPAMATIPELRALARAMISDMTVANAENPETFLRTERRAQRKARAAYARVHRAATGAKPQSSAAKDLMEAHTETQRALFNSMLYAESRGVQKTVNQIRAQDKRLRRATRKDKIASPFVEQIIALLQQYDFRKLSNQQAFKLHGLRELHKELINAGFGDILAVRPTIADFMDRQNYKTMAVSKLRDLKDTLDNLEKLGRKEMKLHIEDREVSYREVKTGALTTLGFHPDVSASLSGTKAEMRGVLARQLLNTVSTADTIIRKIDGHDSDKVGYWWKAIKAPISSHYAKFQERSYKARGRIDKLFKEHYGSSTQLNTRPVYRPEVNHSMTKAEILAVALNTGNEQNMNRLVNGSHVVKFTEENVQALLDNHMTETDWRFVQAFWDEINSYWGEIAANERRLTGVYPTKVEAKLAVKAPGFVHGGYYPIRYDPRLGVNVEEFSQNEIFENLRTGRMSRAQTAHGHVYEREMAVEKPLYLSLSVGVAHINDVIFDLELREPVQSAWRLLNDKDISAAMKQKGLEQERKALVMWLQDVAIGDRQPAEGLNKILRHLRAGLSVAKMGFSMTTIIQQPLGLLQSGVVVGQKDLMRGMLKYLSHPKRYIADATEASPFMTERWRTMERDMAVASGMMDEDPVMSKWTAFHRAMVQTAFMAIQTSQFYMVDMPTWIAAHDQFVAKHGTTDGAVEYADQLLARAQGSGILSDRSAIERGHLTSTEKFSEFARFATTFGSYMIGGKLNVAIQEVREGNGAQAAGVATVRLAFNLMLLYAAESLLSQLFTGRWYDDEEDDDEPLAWWMAKQSAYGVMGSVPLLRDVAGTLQGFDAGGAQGQALGSIGDLVGGTAQIGKAFFDEEGEDGLRTGVRSLIKGGSVLAQLPGVQFERMLTATFERDMSVRSDFSAWDLAFGRKD